MKNYRVHPTRWLISTQALLLAARNATFYFAVRYYTAVVKEAGGVATSA